MKESCSTNLSRVITLHTDSLSFSEMSCEMVFSNSSTIPIIALQHVRLTTFQGDVCRLLESQNPETCYSRPSLRALHAAAPPLVDSHAPTTSASVKATLERSGRETWSTFCPAFANSRSFSRSRACCSSPSCLSSLLSSWLRAGSDFGLRTRSDCRNCGSSSVLGWLPRRTSSKGTSSSSTPGLSSWRRSSRLRGSGRL